MKFKIDENLPIEIAEILIDFGYEAKTVLKQKVGGIKDKNLISLCNKENRILVTLDMDFSDIRNYPPKNLPGIIVLKLKQQDKLYILKIIKQMVKKFSIEKPIHQLWIVEEHQIRIRE